MAVQPDLNLSNDQRPGDKIAPATRWPLATIPTGVIDDEERPRALLIATADGDITIEDENSVSVTIPVTNGQIIPLSPREITAVTSCTVHLLR